MKKILLVATGSVAIIKLLDLKNILQKKYDVKLITTDYVKNNFDQYSSLVAIAENKNLNSFPQHITLAKWSDLIVVVPCSANTLSKFALGIADNFVLTTLLAAREKIIFVPAMNTWMWKALLERGIIDKIHNLGHLFIGPVTGKLREGEIGLGRMEEPNEIAQIIDNYLLSSGKKILIPYGASKVYIDPVRVLTNNSSGKMGTLLVNEFKLRGFDVVGVDINEYSNVEFLNYAKSIDFDIYISPAAFADFNVETSVTKIKKESIHKIKLLNNIDVIFELKKLFPNRKFYGFKLHENKNLAIQKMNNLNLDGIIWNTISSINSDTSTGAIILKNKEIVFKDKSKFELAKMIAKEIN